MCEEPLFTHDCDHCIFLGNYDASAEKGWGMVDLYVCVSELEFTVITRYGNEGWEYGSGLVFAKTSAKYAEAVRRAIDGGHLDKHVMEKKKAEEILAKFEEVENERK